MLIAPLSLGYYFIGRFFFAKSFIASRACDACGACVQQCPTQALQLVDGRPFWSYCCESCMRCMNLCPRRAIETAHGFVVAVPLLFLIVMTALVYPALRLLVPAGTGSGQMTRFLLENAILLAVLFLSYRLLHRALRVPLVERLTVLTSLTHFGFWRRYRVRKADPASVSQPEIEPPT